MNGKDSLVRILLIREYPLCGKKVIFDSGSTLREDLRRSDIEEALDAYDQVNENYGYKLLKPSKEEILEFAELMFGNFPLTDQGSNFKLHLFENEKDFMWSTLYNSSDMALLQSPSLSSSSVGSSFGNSIPGIHQGNGPSNVDLSLCDSGYYNADSMEFSSFSSLSEASNPTLGGLRRQMTGSTGSILPIKATVKERSTIPASMEGVTSSCSTIPSFKIDSVESFKSNTSSKRSDNSTILAIGVIFMTDSRDKLLHYNFFLNELLSFISSQTIKAYRKRREFIHSMFQLTLQVEEDLVTFIKGSLFILEAPIWSIFTAKGTRGDEEMDSFLRTLLRLRHRLDKKENNFLLSTFLTGILSHHLGWIDTVIPREEGRFISESPALKQSHSFEPYQEETRFWYNPQKHQYLDLHGKIGSNTRVTKTVVYSKDEALLKDLITVSSYFIRCSSVEVKRFEDSFLEEKEEEDLSEVSLTDFYAFKGELSNRIQSRSEDPGSLKKETLALKKSFILGDSPSPPDVSKSTSPLPYAENELNIVSQNQELATIRIGKEVPIPQLGHDIIGSKTLPLPCFFQVGKSYMPGCIIQGIHTQSLLAPSSTDLQAHCLLQKHLAGMSTHFSTFIPELDGVQCLNVHLDQGSVDLMNSKKESLGKHSSPVLFSPRVANILDAVVELASIGTLPVLMYIEDRLKEIYLTSKILAEYLMNEELQDISSLVHNLDLDYNDVPLLYSVATTHTPDLSKKYGIGFV